MSNPYPESVFIKMSEVAIKETSDVLIKAGISPDRVFGNWGREVWNNCYKDTLKAVGEWLADITISSNAVANELRIVEAIKSLLNGEMPDE